MRIRNIKGAREKVDNHPIVIKELTNKTFPNQNEIHLEIGMGKGDFIITKALQNPDINFIGVEKYQSIILRAINKLDETPNNLRIICADAINLKEIIKTKITTLYLNFSDPWPKDRHEKRRLTSKEFIEIYETLFNKKVSIYQKTDNKKLFAYSIKSLNNLGYTFNEISLDLHNEDIPNIKTEYEIKFSQKGLTINYLHATKDFTYLDKRITK